LIVAEHQATVLDAVNMVKQKTPVQTGFLRANWTVIRNNEPMPVPNRVESPETSIAALRIGDRVIVVNPVVYAARVNFGFVGTDSRGRHYDQKGAHMVEQTVALLSELAKKATARIAAGGDPLVSSVDPNGRRT
jgi:hypothetical protein